MMSGQLASGMTSRVFSHRGEMGFSVRDRTFYAKFLETGAKGRGKRILDPRPFVSIAFDAKLDEIAQKIEAASNDGITLIPKP
jgi:hypothetical protein